MMKIREGYGMTKDGRKVKIERNGNCEEFPFYHDYGKGSFHGLTEEGMSCIGSDQDDIISMIDDGDASPVRTVMRREVVPGVYGRVGILSQADARGLVVSLQEKDGSMRLNADELRSAAMVLSQLAEALDDIGDEE